MAQLKIYDLSVNYLENPCGLDSNPVFAFKAESGLRGDALKEIRVTVSAASDFENAVWDENFDGAQDPAHIPYAGKPLAPLTKYYFRVQAKSVLGAAGENAGGNFVTGKLGERWTAKWITANFIQKEPSAFAAPYLRKTFEVAGEVKSAYLAICGLGYFESRVNGVKTGEDVLSPGFTEFDKVDLYKVYDVKNLLREGKNAIGVVLGNGWYNCFAEDPWNTRAASWRHWPKVIAEMHIEYEDGRKEVVITDPTWKGSEGPIYFNGIRNGEHYDARRELGAWTEPEYDDSTWMGTYIMKSPGGLLKAMEIPEIRQIDTFPAVRMWKAPSGAYVFDVGQNQAGVGRFVFRGPTGTEITIRYSDMLTEDGEVTQEHIGAFVRSHCFQTDKYIKKSDEEETWQPIFVYHGFQYVELTGCAEEPRLSDVTAITLATYNPPLGEFWCADELITRVQHLCRWSTLSNMHSIPTDCPHREKNGWTGDTSISSEQMLINFNTRAFLSKWSDDLRRSQRPAGQIPCVVPSTGWGYYGLMGPDWSSALINVPYNIYLYNNDREILLRNYEAIKRNFEFMLTMTADYTLDYGTGDWCAPFEGPAISVNMESYKCPKRVSDTAFFYNAARTIVKIARMAGREDEAEYYAGEAEKIRAAFREKLYDAETHTVLGDCQTATAAMIYFGLCTEEEKPLLIQKLISQIEREDWHLDFGILGCKFVMHSLGAAGEGNVGCRMIAQRTFPGCQRWVDLGATTLWECWNGGGSHNHHMFSDLSAFMYKYIGGISPDEEEPGFRHIILRPAVDSGIGAAKASHESMYGMVECVWENKDGKATIEVNVPLGCHATLYLPRHYLGCLADGETILPGVESGAQAAFELVSGHYSLTTKECAR